MRSLSESGSGSLGQAVSAKVDIAFNPGATLGEQVVAQEMVDQALGGLEEAQGQVAKYQDTVSTAMEPTA